jgi:hypothetical protein
MEKVVIKVMAKAVSGGDYEPMVPGPVDGRIVFIWGS